MDKSFCSQARMFFGVLAVPVLLASVMVGCGESNPGGGKGHGDSRLVNSAGQAWILETGIDIPGTSQIGFVFKANGELETVTNATGTWISTSMGTWSTSGGNIILEGASTPYSISSDGNTLTWTGMTYTRKTIGPGGNTGGGSGLVLPDGFAWTNAHEEPVGERNGVIFQSNGTFVSIYNEYGYWDVEESGTWSANETARQLHITVSEGAIKTTITFNYSISANGNTLTLTFDDDDIIAFRKTEIGTLGNGGGDGTSADLVTASGFAWIDDYSPGNRDGFILHSDGTVIHIDDLEDYWDNIGSGTWSVNGNLLTITLTSGDGFYEGTDFFILSNNNNTLRWDGEVFNRTNIGILSKTLAGVAGDSKRERKFQKRLSKPQASIGSAKVKAINNLGALQFSKPQRQRKAPESALDKRRPERAGRSLRTIMTQKN